MRKGPGSVYDKWNIWIRGHYPRILFRLDMGLVYYPAHIEGTMWGEKPGKIY
jgi:hypothetical protein